VFPLSAPREVLGLATVSAARAQRQVPLPRARVHQIARIDQAISI